MVNTLNSKVSISDLPCEITDWVVNDDGLYVKRLIVPSITKQVIGLTDELNKQYFIASDRIDSVTFDIYSDEPIKGKIHLMV